MSAATDLVAQAYALAKKTEHKKLRRAHRRRCDVGAECEAQVERRARTPTRSSERSCGAPAGRTECAQARRSSSATTWFSSSAADVSSVSGQRGFWAPKLFQVVEVKAGKIVRMHDYGTMEEALAGTGHDS